MRKTIAGCLLTLLVTGPALTEIQGGETGDGQQTIYGILIGGSDSAHWEPVRDFYNLLIDPFAASESNLFVFLGNDGIPASAPERVTGKATRANLEWAVSNIAARIDAEDVFVFFVEWEGNGYLGAVTDAADNVALHGYFGVPPHIAGPGDERDYRETDIELSLFCAAGGLKDGRDFHYGMGEWGVKWYPHAMISRSMVLSHFTNMFVQGIGLTNDGDVFIERFTDFTQGDSNKNGSIETALGEVWDFDGDGRPPWDRATGQFDEDDWGPIDAVQDNCPAYTWHSPLPGVAYTVYDAGLDHHADIDINPGALLEIDGTDTHNDGCIDGIDLNDDGDWEDWIALDETLSIYGGLLTDDEIRDLTGAIRRGTRIFIINTCYGGGFINDLSAANTLIITGSREICRASAGFLTSLITQAFGVYAPEADLNADGRVSFLEAFNHASLHPHTGCLPEMARFQYDDNGDQFAHEDSLPNGGDGEWGKLVGLAPWPTPPVDADADGIADYWEVAGFGSTTPISASTDTDADGFSDRNEYLAGTNPTNQASFLALQIDDSNHQVRVTVQTRPAEGPGYFGQQRYYDLESRTAWKDSEWQGVTGKTHVAGDGSTLLHPAPPTSDAPVFFRVNARLE